jgi:ectoine hydroxylase-related dioxygenase (phytanoyl-CoA dioxygenase family)
MPSPTAARLQYQTEGYLIERAALPEVLIDEARLHLAAMIAELPSGSRPESMIEPHVQALDWAFWLELCRHPAVVARAAECLGAEEVILLMSHLIVKPAGDGLAVAWHQDNTYWPSVHGTDVLTAWLALDQADLGNACMQVIPRSQAGHPALEKVTTDGHDLLKVTVAVDAGMIAAAVPIELSRGQYSLHDSFIIHGSDANTSARRRAGYTMRYANAASVRVDLDRHWNPVYYVCGDGRSLLPGMVDIRRGCPLPAARARHARAANPLPAG